ncbi:MAG TPA: hypothetical protein VGE52_06710, partial [Pirellulales bacterium]
ARLDQTPKRSGPPPSKLVTIPNPRPAPPGAQRLNFLCAYNRLFFMDIDELRKDAETRTKALITRHKLNTDPAKGIDAEQFEKLFLRLADPRDDFLNVEYYLADKRWPRMRLTANERRGATEKDLLSASSRIRIKLGAVSPQKHYAMFYVMPDSFDIYIAARQFMTAANIQAGWEPMPESWTYTTSVPGVEVGPPRPPGPKPPPSPPTKPANVLD